MTAPSGHVSLAAGRWHGLSLLEQLANIGSEVDRTFRAADQGRMERRDQAFDRALELFDLTAADERWRGPRQREVLRARDDVQCVIHSHPIHAVAFSSLGKPLVAVSNAAGYFAEGRLPIFSETTDLIINQERGKAVARCLGRHAALILRNHGIVATGGSIAEAVWCAIKLE